MGKSNNKINVDSNNHPVGLHGGRKASDLNNKDSNLIKPPYDLDHDGKPDYGVSREESEDVNASEE